MCKGSNSTTSSSRPDEQAYALYSQLLSRAQGVANTPFQPYSGEFVAPVNQQQNLGIANINAAQPAFDSALTLAQQAAQPLTAEQLRQYQSPYTQDVVNATQAQFNNQNAQAQNALRGQAASQNALGGNRISVAEGQLANQQQLAQAPIIASLINQGYSQAAAMALAQQEAMARGAQGVANIGQGQLGAAGAQISAGTLQQGTQQAQDSALYNQFLQQQAYPFQTTQWLAGLGTGVGSQMGGTSTVTPPKPSVGSQIMGGLGAGVGMLGASGAFGAGGWLAPAMMALNRGGGVSGYAEGGGVAGPETLPEPPETLEAQQEQLLNGGRKAQMFPNGTAELPVPEGLARTDTPKGAFHFDPSKIGVEDIHSLSGANRENELLDLGPFSKEQIAAFVAQGEEPFAIVERTLEGVEVRAAVGTKSTLPAQLPVFEQKKAPGNLVQVEPLTETLAKRQASQGVANRDVGGSVNGNPMAGAPYGTVKSWVPASQITRGSGAPRTPGIPQQKSGSSLQDQMKNIIGLGKSIYTGMQGPTGPLNILPPNAGGGVGLDPSEEGAAPSQLPELSGVYRRGGSVGVAGYAGGGGLYDDDEIDPTYPPTRGFVDRQPRGPTFGEAQDFGFRMPPKMASSPDLVGPGIGDEGVQAPQPPAQVEPVAPVPDASAIGVAAPERLPRGIRNNNPGNIEDGPFAKNLPGYMGGDGRFARFETPEAGQKAAEVLLANYGTKGVNTLSGIVNRWAPSSDGNDTQAYVAALSKETGIPPDQPINLNDPQVRSVVAKSIFNHENGGEGNGGYAPKSGATPAIPVTQLGGGVQLANYMPSEKAPPNGVDWSGNSKLWPSLMAAGFGMMSSQSPFLGQALGEGGMQGVATYQGLKTQENQQALSRSRLELEAKRLAQQADIAEKNLKLHTMPYTDLTLGQRKQLAIDAAKLAEQQRHNNFMLRKPEKYMDARGVEHMVFPSPSPDGKSVEWSEYDPATRQMTPLGKGLPNTTSSPLGGPPGFGMQGPQGQGGFQRAEYTPDLDKGVFLANQELIKSGTPVDYSGGSPYIEKGMDVPEPGEVAGRSPQSLKTDAEMYLQTGKLPVVRSGRNPVAIAETNYRRAVQNYGNALAQSRGMTPEQIADAWRTAPGTLRFILGADGRATVSLGTAVRHLDTLAEYAKAWNAGDQQTINKLSAAISREFGGTSATNLETVARIVGPEIVKAIGVAGAGTAEDRDNMTSQFTTARSYPQVMGAVVATQKLMGGQLEGKERQAANAGVSKERFRSLIGERPYEILTNSEKGSQSLTKPSLEQFLTAAKKANPNASEKELTDYYKKKYP